MAHSHAGIDPHTWSNPVYCQKQAVKVATKLKSLSPKDANLIDANLKSLKQDLDNLDAKAQKDLSRLKNIP